MKKWSKKWVRISDDLTDREIMENKTLCSIVQSPFPKTRGDCVNGPRPCTHLSCRYHLLLDVSSSGFINVNREDLDLDAMEDTCALDVADRRSETTLEELATLLNVTRERIRQIEFDGLRSLYRIASRLNFSFRDFITVWMDSGD